VVGHSAGAYNATLAILDTRYLKDADADPSAILGVATMAGPFDFLPLDTEVTVATFGDVTDLTSTQPINFARSESPPFLLLSGTADTTVYPKNSRALAQRMKDVGASVETKEYEDMNHTAILTALAKPMITDTTPVLRDILTFFGKLLKESRTQ
jgi:dipeptidyl aminopeptidase/acylaminoacyl peptidase